jgi:hypothetical protein
MAEKLSYAKNEHGDIVNILDVKNGASCNCVCLCCNNPLIAKQGNIKKWHFSHISSECKYARETELHYLAKMEIEKRMEVPVLDILEYEWNKKEDEHAYIFMHNNKYLSREYIRMVKIDKVYIEKSMGDFKPDVIVIISGNPLLVEIAVTHFIDSEKEQKIIKSGMPCMEIDLSKYKKMENIDIGDILFNKIDTRNIKYFNNEKILLKEKRIKDKNTILNTIDMYNDQISKANTVMRGTNDNPFIYCKETALKIHPLMCNTCKYKICNKKDGAVLCSFRFDRYAHSTRKYIYSIQKKLLKLGHNQNFINLYYQISKYSKYPE